MGISLIIHFINFTIDCVALGIVNDGSQCNYYSYDNTSFTQPIVFIDSMASLSIFTILILIPCLSFLLFFLFVLWCFDGTDICLYVCVFVCVFETCLCIFVLYFLFCFIFIGNCDFAKKKTVTVCVCNCKNMLGAH